MAEGQTFLDRLQEHKVGQGTVTVTQSEAISHAINWAKASQSTSTPSTSSTPQKTAPITQQSPVAEADTTTIGDSSEAKKKVLGRGQKVDGYRVQAYAGGSSKADKQKAEQVGERIKEAFPEEPIYVHFYSPRWICRVGNYRTYEEAHRMLEALKGIGLTQSSIVKGKITIQY